MTQLSDDQVRHIAKLARLELDEADIPRFAKELSAIIGYIEKLQEVDTSDVEPLAQVTNLSNCFREDTVRDDGVSPDALLECSPLPIVENQIETPSAHNN